MHKNGILNCHTNSANSCFLCSGCISNICQKCALMLESKSSAAIPAILYNRYKGARGSPSNVCFTQIVVCSARAIAVDAQAAHEHLCKIVENENSHLVWSADSRIYFTLALVANVELHMIFVRIIAIKRTPELCCSFMPKTWDARRIRNFIKICRARA